MIRFLRRVADDRQGVAAMEFALIFPLIFLLNMGAVEALQVYQAQRNVSHIAATVADITAQGRTVTDSELRDILSAGISMMHPFPNAGLQQRLSSFSASSNGTVSRDWTYARDYKASGDAAVPSGYLGANESVIVSDVIYDYEPAFGFFLPDKIRMTRHAYARPRLTLRVEKVTD